MDEWMDNLGPAERKLHDRCLGKPRICDASRRGLIGGSSRAESECVFIYGVHGGKYLRGITASTPRDTK